MPAADPDALAAGFAVASRDVERAIGFDSTFFTARELRDRMEAAGLDARVIGGGFACTAAGRKPGGQ